MARHLVAGTAGGGPLILGHAWWLMLMRQLPIVVSCPKLRFGIESLLMAFMTDNLGRNDITQ